MADASHPNIRPRNPAEGASDEASAQLAEADPTYVNGALYAALAAEARDAPTHDGDGDERARGAAERFSLHEGRLLDERRLEEWADLFTLDCIYWVPADFAGGDPAHELAVAFSDRRRLLDRVAYLRTGTAWSQEPPSRTLRAISNVETWVGADGARRIRSNVVIWEYRFKEVRPFPARQHAVIAETESGWRIRWKFVHLLECDGQLPNIAFIV